MSSLIVKIDNIAFLRNASGGDLPEPSHAAVLVQMAGAAGVCCHLREDRLHTTDRDLYVLREVVKNKLILKIYPESDLIERALEVRPDLTILMPRSGDDVSVEKGVDISSDSDLYQSAVERLKRENLRTGLFIDPGEVPVKDAARLKVDLIELNCFDFVTSRTADDDIDSEWERLEFAAQLGSKLGMQVACANQLRYDNIVELVGMDVFKYISIGGAIVSKAVLVGFEQAVREAVEMITFSDE